MPETPDGGWVLDDAQENLYAEPAPPARRKRSPIEKRFVVWLEGREGRPLTDQEANLAIRQCLELNGTLGYYYLPPGQ